jgi:hypothetical protein
LTGRPSKCPFVSWFSLYVSTLHRERLLPRVSVCLAYKMTRKQPAFPFRRQSRSLIRPVLSGPVLCPSILCLYQHPRFDDAMLMSSVEEQETDRDELCAPLHYFPVCFSPQASNTCSVYLSCPVLFRLYQSPATFPSASVPRLYNRLPVPVPCQQEGFYE